MYPAVGCLEADRLIRCFIPQGFASWAKQREVPRIGAHHESEVAQGDPSIDRLRASCRTGDAGETSNRANGNCAQGQEGSTTQALDHAWMEFSPGLGR